MADPAHTESTLEIALRYASLGLRVLPIKPGTKRPPMREWVEAATTNTDIITSWYTEPLYRDHGIGLAMGHQPNGRSIFTLDVDEHNPAYSGRETLHDMTASNGALPDTWCSITGSNGLHLIYAAPAGIEVRNTVAGPGIDVRGEGGQIVVYPTIHPGTGVRYEWEDTYAPWDRPIGDAPSWLMRLVYEPPSPPSPPTTAFHGPDQFATPDSPAEWLRARWDWRHQLLDAGWAEHSTARGGMDIFWTRPGKDRRAGESAVLHMPDGPLVIWSTDPELAVLRALGRPNSDDSVSVSPFEFYAAQRHAGDLSRAGRAVREMMDPPDRRLSAPSVSDPMQSVVDRYVGQVLDWPKFWTDDHSGEEWIAEPVIPAGRLTVFYAPAKQGKSEITLAVVAALATGKKILGRKNPRGPVDVVYLDYEMTRADLAERLGMLGYTNADDLTHLHYYLLPSLPSLDTAEGASVIRQIAAYHSARVVVIDTMGRAVEGDENSNDTYRAFARFTGLGLKADGIAVVRTDHAGKDKEKGQRGASAKNDDADVVFRIDRVDQGWKLTRTHTRVSWVPETVVIERRKQTSTDGEETLIIEAAAGTVTYPDGTAQYVAKLRAEGIVVDASTSYTQLKALTEPLGLSKSKTKMLGAIKMMVNDLTPYEPEPRIEKPF